MSVDAKKFWEVMFKYRELESDDLPPSSSINRSASDADLNVVESHFGVKLPPAMRAFYKTHNGQDIDLNSLEGSPALLPGGLWLLGTHEIVKIDAMYRDYFAPDSPFISPTWTAASGIQNVQWDTRWIPLTAEEDHKPTIYVLDCNPGHGGKVGQIVKIEARGNARTVVAKGFESWIKAMQTHAEHELRSSGFALEGRPLWLRW